MADILIIDDDKMVCDALAGLIRIMGHRVVCAQGLKEGLEKVHSGPVNLVFLDVHLPDGNGLSALPEIRETPSSPEVIIITGEGDPDGAELAVTSGSWDYLQKPFSAETIKQALKRVLQYQQEKADKKPPSLLKREDIIGGSARMKQALEILAKASCTDANVLITGETGTGKELFAKAIHENSNRGARDFVVVDSAALPETLVESILFGHEKGAFTGADRPREGLIKQADGGTLFLDEVGELPFRVQKIFLRVLQERRFRPVGAKREIESDFRLVAATNSDLAQRVQRGRFRHDLLFRLRSIEIDLPPLRTRPRDIEDLAFYYMRRVCRRYGIGTKGFSPEFMEALAAYSWPGNVRELINALERAISMARDEHTLFPIHLPGNIRGHLVRASIHPKPPDASDTGTSRHISASFPKLRTLLEKTEKQYLEELTSFTGGSVKAGGMISGLSRSRLYDRLKKYSIETKG